MDLVIEAIIANIQTVQDWNQRQGKGALDLDGLIGNG